MTVDDLKNYRAIERTPVRGTYRGYDIVSMPPPSSGGVELIEMLNILEGYDLAHDDDDADALSHDRSDEARLCRSRAVPRRSRYRNGSRGETHREELCRRVARHHRSRTCDARRATSAPAATVDPEGHNTTHFSIVDRFGNAVSNTYTLNFSYGVGLVADGTGILLNNELDDFAAKPEAPNAYGLIGFEANEPGPGKRPVSSMTPTIILKDGKPFLVTGSPGGSRIITAVLQVIVNVIDRGMAIADAVAAPRVHNQWMPDQVFAEPALPPDIVAALQARGDKVVPQRPFTSADSILITPEGFIGVADPRTRGALAVGY